MAPDAARFRFGPGEVEMLRRDDGTLIFRSPHSLGPHGPHLIERLEHWAATAPDRSFLAERAAQGEWRRLSYAGARAQARSIAQGLIDRGLTPERPVAVLSGNGIDHALMALGAMHAGIPFACVSVAYSLIAKDFAKLRAILSLLNPGLVFADDGAAFAPAFAAAAPADAEFVACSAPDGLACTPFATLAATPATAAVDAALAGIGPDTVAKILFTSGSTGTPKGVINTHRMMTSNQRMLATAFPALAETPPVLLDWLPWSHTFGGNQNFNLVLTHGGTFHIDAGKPVPEGIAATLRNLSEVSPTVWFNVPKGYEMLLPHLETDPALRESLFRRLQCMFYSGAGLPPHVWEAYERLARATTGREIPMLTSLGATETAPSALCVAERARRPGVVGIPNVGVELKLVPSGAKLEARLRGPMVTPGYWRQPELTAQAFDEEGFYRLGDALRLADEGDPGQGFIFDGRIAEDFKLRTGTWVSVGPLRARLTAACAPLVRDAVIAGHDREAVTALVVPDLAACAALAGVPGPEALSHPAVRDRFASLLAAFNAGAAGSSARLARLVLLTEPPSLDTGEMTDKGSINQRSVLARRAALVEALYADPPGPGVIVPAPAAAAQEQTA